MVYIRSTIFLLLLFELIIDVEPFLQPIYKAVTITTTTTETMWLSRRLHRHSILASSTTGCRKRHVYYSIRGSMLMAGTKNASLSKSASRIPTLRSLSVLSDEIVKLNNNQLINPMNPGQVALAVFGSRSHSTSRESLEYASNNSEFTLEQQMLALKVLQYQDLYNMQHTTTTSSSSINDDQINESTTVTKRSNMKQIGITSTSATTTQSQDDSIISYNPTVQSMSSAEPLPYEEQVHNLVCHKKSQIPLYWKDELLKVSRPTARALVAQLESASCPMGYNPLAKPSDQLWRTNEDSTSTTTATTTAGKKGSFLAYYREQKKLHPECVILTRCGDFYEVYGVDAVMLVEHCGLNPMAGKAKAGCPYRNVQATLNALTSNGLTVAVYEEASDMNNQAATTTSKVRIKSRFLAQIVSPASPTYMYDLVLSSPYADTLTTGPPSRPFVGILNRKAGYTLVEVSIEEQSVRVMERLTPEAVTCRLAAYPPTDPLFYVPSLVEYNNGKKSCKPRFIPTSNDINEHGPGSSWRTQIIPPHLSEKERDGISEAERAKNVVVSALIAKMNQEQDEMQLTPSQFSLVANNVTYNDADIAPQALYLETATQLGLMNDPTIPSIISAILPTSAPASTKQFLRRYLLAPPPPHVARAMAILNKCIKNENIPLPPLAVPSLGKLLALLRAEQASAQVFAEIMRMMESAQSILNVLLEQNSEVNDALMTLVEYESGMAANSDVLRLQCKKTIETISSVLSTSHTMQSNVPIEVDSVSNYGNVIPSGFFERNELQWRYHIQATSASNAYINVELAAHALAEAVIEDFWLMSMDDYNEDPDLFVRTPIAQDIFNNNIALKSIPNSANSDNYYHPRDRNGKLLRNRYTTERVDNALDAYINACESACQEVSQVLVQLSKDLSNGGHVPSIVQASYMNLICSASLHHTAEANKRGWDLATVVDAADDGNDCAGTFVSVWPYWMDRSQAVPNSFDLDGMWVLTAPNMAGKSTLMRSTAASALLSICGLCAPLHSSSVIRRFDHVFVRGASSDAPSEQKSAFGAEMGDISALLQCCGENSLVFVDELGRGTSPQDGTRLAAAVLEAMATSGMSGIFATHLHDILQLPLKASNRIKKKRMAVDNEYNTRVSPALESQWTYRLEDGVCTDSLALVTAKKFGVPLAVLQRAEELLDYLPHSQSFLRESSSQLNGLRDNEQETDNIKICNEENIKICDEVTNNNSIRNTFSVRELLELTIGQPAYTIPARWEPPAVLDGRSCVYVLKLSGVEPRYYVGETDNFRHRISQHRRKQGDWEDLLAIAVPVSNKSEARVWESRIIQLLSQEGMSLVSTSDGRSIRRFQYNNNKSNVQ